MIPDKMEKRVVTIGPHYNDHGGMASVISCYKDMFRHFRFIPTSKNGGMIQKAILPLIGMLKLVWYRFSGSYIAHIHTASRISFWRKAVFIIEAKLLGMKVILHIHGGGFAGFVSQHKKIVPFILKRCNIVIALSILWKDYFIHELNLQNVYVIHNIIPFPKIKKINKFDCLSLLFLGAIVPDKGIFDLVECLAINKHLFKDKVRLYIGGNGNIEGLQTTVRDKGVDDMVVLLGWVEGEEKIDLLNKSNVYILPSYVEGLPISILEAMSYGMAIISTSVGSIPEVVKEDNGIIVQPGDLLALRDAILFFLKNPESVGIFGKASRQRSMSYLPNAVEEQLIMIYDKL